MVESNQSNQRFFSVSQAADYLGVSSKTLRRWEASGILESVRTAGNQRRYLKRLLDEFLERKNSSRKKRIYLRLAKKAPALFSLEGRRFSERKKNFWPGLIFPLFCLLIFAAGSYQLLNQGLLGQFSSQSKKVFPEPKPEPVVLGKEELSLVAPGPDFLKTTSVNLLKSSSFEVGEGGTKTGVNELGQPKHWGYAGMAHKENIFVSQASIRSGALALKAEDKALTPGAKMNFGITQSSVTTRNGADYNLSIFIRTKDIIGNPKIRIGFIGIAAKSDPNYGISNWENYSADKYQDFSLAGLTDWQRFSFTYHNAALGKYPFFEIIDYRGGTVFFDDAQMTEGETALVFHREVTSLGDGGLIADPAGNLYPYFSEQGNLGGSDNRFASLYVNDAYIEDNLDVSDGLAVAGNLSIGGTTTIGGDVVFSGSFDPGNFNSNLIPSADDAYDLGSSAYKWRDLYIDGKIYADGFQMATGAVSGYMLISDASGNASWADTSLISGYWTLSSTNLYPDSLAYKIGIGTASPISKLHVSGAVAGKALAILDELGDQNILTASASGVTAANLTRSGDLELLGQGDLRLYDSNNSQYTGFQAPADVTSSNSVYTMPAAYPGSAAFMKSDDSGVLSWDTGTYDNYSSWTIADDDTGAYSIVSGNVLRFTSSDSNILTNLLNGDDGDENLDLTVRLLGDLVAGNGLSGGADNVLVGADGDTTFSIDQTYNFSWTGTHSWSNSADFNGDVSIADTNIALDGATTTFTSTGDISLDSGGGQLILGNGDTLNIGGVTNLGYNAFSDSTTAGYASTDDDLYIEDILEVDGNAYLTSAYFGGGTSYYINSSGQALFNTNETINGIDIDAGAVTDVTNLTASGTITFSGLGPDTDDTVVILNGSNQLTTAEIDSDVWTAVDNYGDWDWYMNGVKQKDITSGATAGLDESTAIDLSYNDSRDIAIAFDSTELGTTTWGANTQDIVWTFDGQTNDGTFGFYEDEDAFAFTNSSLGIGTTFTTGTPVDKLTIAGGSTTVYDTASLGSEKVSNGTFVDNSVWTWGVGWIHDDVNLEADHSGIGPEVLEQDISAVAGEIYQVVFTVKNRSTGVVVPQVGGVSGVAISSNTTSTQQIRATGTGNLKFTPSYDFNGSIDDVSVKLVSGGDLKLAGLLTGGGASGIKVTAEGNVGIGTTSPGEALEVSGTVTATDFSCSDCLGQGDIGNSAVGRGELKTATNVVSGSSDANIALQDYTFFPNLDPDDCSDTQGVVRTWLGDTTDTTVAKFYLKDINCSPGTWDVRYRYITSSDHPAIWVLANPDGSLTTVSEAEDPAGEYPNNPNPLEGTQLEQGQRFANPGPLKIDQLQILYSSLPDQDRSKIIDSLKNYLVKERKWIDYFGDLGDLDKISERYKLSSRLWATRFVAEYYEISPSELILETMIINSEDELELRPNIGQVLFDHLEDRKKRIAENAQREAELKNLPREQQDADIAEWYSYQLGTGEPEAGDIISIGSSGFVVKSNQAYDPNLIGIISTAPSEVIGKRLGSNDVRIALTGRVPVRVSVENGLIESGDSLTTSSLPGVAMKSTKPGKIIGYALEDYSGEQIGKIMTFVNISWHDPDVYLTDLGNLEIIRDGQDSQFQVINSGGDLIERAGVFSQAMVGNLETGFLDTKDLAADKLTLAGRQVDLLSFEAKLSGQSLALAGLDSRLSSLEVSFSDVQEFDLDSLEQRVEFLEAMAFDQNLSSQEVSAGAPDLLSATEASFAADLSGGREPPEVKLSNNLTLYGDFNVLGEAIVSDLGVTGKISAGLLVIDGLFSESNSENPGASLFTLSGPLKLQEMALGSLEIMGGLIVMDPEGNIKAEKISVKTVEAEEFLIKGNKSAGRAVLPNGKTSVVVGTDSLTEGSLIFVTSLKVPIAAAADKVADNKFEIKISEPQAQDLEFNWWIVSQE